MPSTARSSHKQSFLTVQTQFLIRSLRVNPFAAIGFAPLCATKEPICATTSTRISRTPESPALHLEGGAPVLQLLKTVN